jgi:hypothetical protein
MDLAAANQREGQQRAQPRGRPFPPGVSGNPSGAQTTPRRAAELYEALARDFAHLSSGDAVLLQQAARSFARAERPTCGGDEAVRLVALGHRILVSLRKRAAPAAQSAQEALAQYLAQNYGGAADPLEDEGAGADLENTEGESFAGATNPSASAQNESAPIFESADGIPANEDEGEG